MHIFSTCFFFWLLAVCGESFLFTLFGWFNPGLFFLVPLLFGLHWRGRESIFIFTLFGITADSFSTLPFGSYSLIYLSFSFFVRWYAIKVFQESAFTIAIVSGVFLFVAEILVSLLQILFFDYQHFDFSFVSRVFLTESIPTAVLAYPIFLLLLQFEKRFKIHLAERIF